VQRYKKMFENMIFSKKKCFQTLNLAIIQCFQTLFQQKSTD